MSFDRGKRKHPAKPVVRSEVRLRPSSDDAHEIVYFQRHKKNDPEQSEPGRDALNGWPASVRAKARAALASVAAAPPKKFSGAGWHELRINGPKRHHYRLFCLLDYEAKGTDKALLVVIDGRDKPFRTELSKADYAAVRRLGDEYLARNPRSLVVP
jgi:hypothetical protein